MRKKRVPHTAIRRFVDLVHSEGYQLTDKYIDYKTPISAICPNSHLIKIIPTSFSQGHRCKVCQGIDTTEAKRKFILTVTERGYTLIGEYINSKTKVELLCPMGHRWSVLPNSFRKGHGCRVCAGQDKESAERKFLSIAAAKQYKVIGKYINDRTKVTMECAAGHLIAMSPGSLISDCSCRVCANLDPVMASQKYYNHLQLEGYTPITEYVKASQPVKLVCPNGHRFELTPNAFQSGYRCTECWRLKNKSETLCRDVFEEMFGKPFPAVRPKWLRSPDTNRPLELDGYNEELQLAFEYNGPHHYINNRYGADNQLSRIQKYDKIKVKECMLRGITLVIIPYTVKYNDIEGYIEGELEVLHS